MITKLTPEQEALLEKEPEIWLAHAYSTEPCDRAKAEAAAAGLYTIAGYNPPEKFVWVDSPLAAETYLNERLNQPKGTHNDTSTWGSQEAYWVGYYSFVRDKLGVEFDKKDSDDLDVWIEYVKQCFWTFNYDEECILSERPTALHVNEERKLHNPDGPAVAFKDGFKLFYINGINVPEYIATTPGDELDVLKVLAETNVDVRREGLKKISLERVEAATNAKVLDTKKDPSKPWVDYTLLDMDFKDDKVRKVLKMFNPSAKAYHYERVEDDITTVNDALAFRDGEEVYVEPQILT